MPGGVPAAELSILVIHTTHSHYEVFIMKKTTRILWGSILIAVGVIFALNALDVTNINLFFKGWWTLFIIVPCAIALFTQREKTSNIIGLSIGVILLLCCQGILSYTLLWKLALPAVIIIVGLHLMFTGMFGSKSGKVIKNIKAQGRPVKTSCAVFSGCDLRYDGEVFEGANLTAVFGGVVCNLKNAIIEKDCVIQVTAVFGGIDILVPDGVNVKTSCTCIFGGTENKTAVHTNRPTVYVSGLCMFGGVEVK